jgi:hypothetical protein
MSNFYTQEKNFIPVQGFEHEYKIANDGRVLSLITDAYVRTNVDTHGYLIVNLYKDGKRTTARLHVLVAKHFIPNPDNLPVVNHIDGNKQNPHYTNLEWCTYAENTQHAHQTGLQTTTSNKIVVRDDGVEYPSLTAAAEANNTDKAAISKVLHGKKKTAGGHTWSLKQ